MCPIGVGLITSSNKDARAISDQEQDRRSTEDHGQPAEEGSHRACRQEPLPGLLQYALFWSKEDEDLWPMTDLSTLNRHLVVTLLNGDYSVCQNSDPGTRWAVSVDIRDPYLCVPVSSSAEVPSVLHQQTHLPSHMSTIWTGNFSTGVHQTSEAGSASITSARVRLHVYLDDRLIWADSTEMESYQLVIYECCTVWDGS